MKGAALGIAVILLAGVAAYSHVSTVYFCGYDDFLETHRANFEDRRAPARIFTTTHFQTTKYRPLNRVLTYICWHLGGGSAIPFRVRNLVFHLIAAVLVWRIALVLTGDLMTALAAGLLFCLHPLVNQNISAAIFTNTAAYSALLGSFLLFLFSLRDNGRAHLIGSLGLALIGLFLYESDIVVFGMMTGYLLLWRLQGRTIERSWMIAWASGSATVLLIFSTVRHFVVSLTSGSAPLPVAAHNVLVYAAALLSPVDPVLASSLFGSSLPPDIHPGHGLVVGLTVGVAAILLVVFILMRSPAGRAWTRRMNGGLILFLVFSIIMALTPVLVFAPHASETYLYLPVALYSILLSLVLRNFRNRAGSVTVLALLLLSFFAGTWIRNQRVASCGVTAQRILSQLPAARWARGTWHILLANSPEESLLRRYGVYAYQGLSTIDPSEPDTPAAEAAIQDETGNEQVQVQVVAAAGLNGQCAVPETCYLVSQNGGVRDTAVTPAGP
jgi:hypothetical protein